MAPTYEDILTLFREVAESQKETDLKFQETHRIINDLSQTFSVQSQKTDLKFQETDRLIKELSRTFGGWSNRLGEFVEEMVRPAVLRLFRSRGLEVHQVMRDVTAINDDGTEGIEIDLLITNVETAIGVECKSRLTLEDVQEHLARLEKFKRLFPQYAGYRLMGAVAAMALPDEVARFAYRQGLFVLAQSGDAILIRNDDRFTPKEW